MAITDEESNEIMSAIINTLFNKGSNTVSGEAVHRNETRQFDPPEGEQVDAEKAGRSSKDVKVNCKNLLKKTVGIIPK